MKKIFSYFTAVILLSPFYVAGQLQDYDYGVSYKAPYILYQFSEPRFDDVQILTGEIVSMEIDSQHGNSIIYKVKIKSGETFLLEYDSYRQKRATHLQGNLKVFMDQYILEAAVSQKYSDWLGAVHKAPYMPVEWCFINRWQINRIKDRPWPQKEPRSEKQTSGRVFSRVSVYTIDDYEFPSQLVLLDNGHTLFLENTSFWMFEDGDKERALEYFKKDDLVGRVIEYRYYMDENGKIRDTEIFSVSADKTERLPTE